MILTSRPPIRAAQPTPRTAFAPPKVVISSDVPQEVLAKLPPGFVLVKTSNPAAEVTLAGLEAGGLLKIVQTQTPLTEPPFSFEAYCTDPALEDVQRPKNGSALRASTFNVYRKCENQLRASGVQTSPPDALAYRRWELRHPKTAAACSNHRSFMKWKLAYYGQPCPDFLMGKPGKVKDVNRARKERKMPSARIRFFHPDDHLSMIRAGPRSAFYGASGYEDQLNVETFRTVAWTQGYVGTRSGEPFYWRLKDFNPKLPGINAWDTKKEVRRWIVPPEKFALRSLVDPSLARYVSHVRPMLDPEGEFSDPEDPIFLVRAQGRVEKWPNVAACEKFLKRGIVSTLGAKRDADVPAPHGFRRIMATMRRHYGATIEQIATFMNDTVAVVEASYIDRTVLQSIGVRRPNGLMFFLPPMPRFRYGKTTFGMGEESATPATAGPDKTRVPLAAERVALEQRANAGLVHGEVAGGVWGSEMTLTPMTLLSLAGEILWILPELRGESWGLALQKGAKPPRGSRVVGCALGAHRRIGRRLSRRPLAERAARALRCPRFESSFVAPACASFLVHPAQGRFGLSRKYRKDRLMPISASVGAGEPLVPQSSIIEPARRQPRRRVTPILGTAAAVETAAQGRSESSLDAPRGGRGEVA